MIRRNAGVIALVIACVGVAGGIYTQNQETNSRLASEKRDRIDTAKSIQDTRREACLDANIRNAKVYLGVHKIAEATDTAPAVYAPLTEALAPRNCKSLYPPPDANGRVTRGKDDRSVRFTSCDEASEAGMTPLYEGQPGYRATLDGDQDGVACE